MAEASDPRAKLLKLLEADQAAFAVYVEKRDALYAEMCAVLRREPGIGERLRVLKESICQMWQGRYHERMEFDHVKHTGWLKKQCVSRTDAEILAKWGSYLGCEDGFYVKARHPFSMFMPTINQWKGIPSEPDRVDSGDKLREYRG